MVGSGRNGDQAGAGARLPNGLNALKQQAAVVRGEAQRKARFTPLRKLLAQAPDILLALRPHWVASPLNVSRLLPQTSWFDLVLIDEGSQVVPEDAIPVLARGRQVVIAGYRHQLPPTKFFCAPKFEHEQWSF